MRNKILSTISILALAGMSSSALAETINSENIARDTKKAVAGIKADASDAYDKVKATLIGHGKKDNNVSFVIDSRKTANGIIGHDIYNEKNERVGKIADIIIDDRGKAIMLVVVGDKFMGMGKQAAFDFSAVTRVEDDGDVIMPLTEEIIDNAAPFSYDKIDGDERVRVVPDNGYRISKILEGKLVNQKSESIADIENISFQNGMVSKVIIGFDKTLGFGGKMAAVSYDITKIINDGNALHLQISDEDEVRVQNYKKTAMK